MFSPVDRNYGSFLGENFKKNSSKAAILKTLINSFTVNDLEGGDEISISIYSDVIDDMFKCGQYHFRSGDAVDLHNLVVPCRDLITITLSEKDGKLSNGHTVLVPCNSNSDMTVDLIIPRGSIQKTVDRVQGVNTIFDFLNMFNPFKDTTIGVQITTTISDLFMTSQKNTGTIENEALYNLKMEVVENVDSIYYAD